MMKYFDVNRNDWYGQQTLWDLIYLKHCIGHLHILETAKVLELILEERHKVYFCKRCIFVIES